MEMMNANLLRMQRCTLLGLPALFTPHRIDSRTVHLGFHCYEVQAMRGQNPAIFCLTDDAGEDLYGTVLCLAQIRMGPGDKRVLRDGDLELSWINRQFTPAAFEDLYQRGQLH